MTFDELLADVEMHDELVARRGIEIWIGAEPTFTRPDSLAAAWTRVVEGDDKLERAHTLATALGDGLPGAAVVRVTGRQYPDEPAPRFAFGVRWSDDLLGSTVAGARARADAAAVPPPDDLGTDRWLTVTPDPGVVDVNLAPSETAMAFADQVGRTWRAAEVAGLAAIRHRYNGDVVDSGGGGLITLGGRRPASSPFVRYPHVLPALVRYLNNHPSLSYWFANDCVGSASQGPRPDEGMREHFDELEVALTQLERRADRGELGPEQLWQALAPVLVDGAGNSHRAELNVEKLWNPHVIAHGTRHGKMGVVELRAIRMPERPGMLVALAVLLRSIVARLVVAEYREPLIDWHDELHDRFALPTALAHDLRHVLGDLDEHGLGVPALLRAELDAWRRPGIACRLGDASLVIRPALEFWPLVGDVASQERAGARCVDASTERWELVLDGPGPDHLAVAGRWVTPRTLGADGVRAIGVRRRAFTPSPGLHPGLPPLDPLVIEWAWQGRTQRIELWAWRPSGGAYTGIPLEALEALTRRQERIVIVTRDDETSTLATRHWPTARPFTVDLRGG